MKRNKVILVVIIVVSLSMSCLLWGSQSKKRQKRECTPYDENSPFALSVGMNCKPYKCSKGGLWVIDEEALEKERKNQSHRDELYWALRTRVLDTKEMEEVKNLDYTLLIKPCVPYVESEIRERFDHALEIQAVIKRGDKR